MRWGLGLGVGLAGCRFLCAGKYAPLTEHEWSGPQPLAHGGVTFPGILFMTWRAQEVMNGWLPVFQDVLSQGILSSSTTCGISGSLEEALHVTAIWW